MQEIQSETEVLALFCDFINVAESSPSKQHKRIGDVFHYMTITMHREIVEIALRLPFFLTYTHLIIRTTHTTTNLNGIMAEHISFMKNYVCFLRVLGD